MNRVKHVAEFLSVTVAIFNQKVMECKAETVVTSALKGSTYHTGK